jgi:hypothetical protein
VLKARSPLENLVGSLEALLISLTLAVLFAVAWIVI